jgi:putative cell wall-binding protein
MKKIIPRIVTVFCILFLLIPQMNTKASSSKVSPIDWDSFKQGSPYDDNTQRIEQILLNTNKYGLTTWWDRKKNFDAQTEEYINFGGKLENEIRPPAAMSLGLSTSLAFDVYDSSTTGVSKDDALERTKKLVSSLAYRHRVNSSGGWGNQWQSAHWAYFAGFAGWLLWDELSTEDKEYLRKMVEYEANRFISYDVPYWKSESGETRYSGDTKAEENSWNAQILQLATAMMPDHENWNVWMNKNVELMISSVSVPSDLQNTTIFNGKTVSDWVAGSNINEDGTVINHGFLHPDYMEFIAFNNTAGLQYTLANMPTPKSAFFHSDLVYQGFVDLSFTSPPYEDPGGTIYRDGSSDIYYPKGNDWGTDRRMQFATLDIFADVFNFDQTASKGGDYWEPLHAQMVLDMQNRHKDGRTYDEESEDTYEGREEWVAHHAAWAYIAKWVDHSGQFKMNNEFYGPSFDRLAGSDRYQTAVEISQKGWEESGTVLLARGDNFPDALAGAPLASQYNAPILLTRQHDLPVVTKEEIERLHPNKVIILGGPDAVDNNIEEMLSELDVEVERLGGAERFETASLIAEELDTYKTAYVVNGYNFPDALAIAAVAAKHGSPILLTEKDVLPNKTKQALDNASKSYFIGGTSVISNKILGQVNTAERIGGTNRYDTAAKIITELNVNPEKISLSNGRSYPDALTGSVLAAKQDGSLLMVEKDRVPSETNQIFTSYPIKHFTILGGKDVVKDTIVKNLVK